MKIGIIKKKDDPLALRISIGGAKGSTNDAYITYRGDMDEVKLLLTIVAKAFNLIEKEPEISPDDGKKYA